MVAEFRSAQWLQSPRVARVDPWTEPRWDAFVEAHPEGLVFHRSAWLRVIEGTYRFEPAHLACEDADGSLLGVLPMFRVHGLITGHGLYSLPRTPTAGPLVLDRQAASSLLESALQLTQEKGGGLDIRLRSTQLDGLIQGVAGRQVATAYQVELPCQGEEIRFGNSANHGKIRRAVNKAAREGVEVRPAETEADLQAWYSLYLDTMRSHATPPRPYRFFRSCWELLKPGGLMSLLLAERREAGRTQLLAGSVFLLGGKTVFYVYNGRRRDALPLRPNDAIQWHAIHDAHVGGFRFFDFGEVPEGNTGLAEFKTKWGARPQHLYLYRYPASRSSGGESHSSFRGTRQAMKGVWRRLPLRVTALLGDLIFTYL